VSTPLVTWTRAFRHSLRLQWHQGASWTVVFAAGSIAAAKAYEAAYPTAASRVLLARSVQGNYGLQGLYGVARRIDTVGGFTTWRMTWMIGLLAGAWGLLSSTRVLRGEEQDGRRELVLSGVITASGALLADMTATASLLFCSFIVYGVSLAGAGLPAGGAFALAAGTLAVGGFFAGVGAVTSQLFADRRHATGLAGALLAASFLVRVVADGTRTLGWARWTTPLGWLENIRPFSGTNLVAGVPLLGGAFFFVAIATCLLAARDLGTGLVAERDRTRVRSRLLGGMAGFTLLTERAAVVTWAAGIGLYTFVLGLLTKDVTSFIRQQAAMQAILRLLGIASFNRPGDILGMMFVFAALPIALFAVVQVGAMREEESSGRLDAILARAIGRSRWALTRLAAAIVGVALVAIISGVLAWAGAAVHDSGVPLPSMLTAAANCVPVAVLFLGVAAAAFGVVPRACVPVGIGAVVVSYFLELVGAMTKAPGWVLDLSAFHHVAPAPAAPIDAVAAVVMVAIGLVGVAIGTAALGRRDLVTA
jgi:ABC-2 type transport system permease protein